MKKFIVLNCFCFRCHWDWTVLSVKADREQECPDCRSYDTKTLIKRL